jgi:chromosome segregation ATPase
MEAPDKISSLEARMEEFALRKRNITKLIKQLSSGVQPSATAFDVRAREEMKRTIKGLESELAEIIQEEHDVGLRLHRVQRRRDRDEMYENPTGLWIKRVTTYNG